VTPAAQERGDAVLLTDLYQLTMLQAYWREQLHEPAVFSLYFRRLPERRSYALACGLDAALARLEALHFPERALAYLDTLGLFAADFLDWLRSFRFSGDVEALPEGTPVFPDEPLLEVTAPLGEAQLAETVVMNQLHLQTVLATKASRVVAAAAGRQVVDFGMRRMHGADAALQGARAFYVGGVHATSDLLAGQVHGIPVAGTMAHSYVQAHDSEAQAFRAFADLYPETVLLVDTYDTLEGVRRVIELARELGDAFRVSGVRLDSGDLGELARRARALLDEAGLTGLRIFASGNLDEYRIAELVRAGAPIDAFGVGTRMGVSADAPSLDLAYKLTRYGESGRLKTAPGKGIVPGPKQVFRLEEDGADARDVVARRDESLPGRPLLVPAMRAGKRVGAGCEALEDARERAARELARLPARLRALEPAHPPYPVSLSPALRDYERAVRERVRSTA
jgi:nicotinate phosphoribosyltransferase